MTWRRPSTYVAYPDDRAAVILGSSAQYALGLDIAAWSESSRYALDGILPTARVRHIIGWTASRQRELVAGGFWQLQPDGVRLVGYLDFNNTRARIEAIKIERAAAGAARAAGAQRDDGGRVLTERLPRLSPIPRSTVQHFAGTDNDNDNVSDSDSVSVPPKPPAGDGSKEPLTTKRNVRTAYVRRDEASTGSLEETLHSKGLASLGDPPAETP
jgi:hypothetical protein